MVLRPEGGGRFELDYSLMQSLFDLFTRTRRIDVASAAQARVQAEVMMQLVRIAQDTEAAYFEAMALRKMHCVCNASSWSWKKTRSHC